MDTAPKWNQWVEAMRFYRSIHNGTRWLWTSTDAERIVCDYAFGRIEYRTPADLRELFRLERNVLGPKSVATQHAFGWELAQIADAFPRIERGEWQPLIDEFSYRFTTIDARTAVWINRYVTLSTTPPPEVANARALADSFFNPNPLTRAWELWHIYRLFQAAHEVLTRVMADLIRELAEDTPLEHLAFATSDYANADQLRSIEQRALAQFGLPGDPRRTLNQWDSWPMIERLYSPAAASEHFPAAHQAI